MDSSASHAPDSSKSRWRIGGVVLAILAYACFGGLLASRVGAWAGGSDSSGYLNNARLIRSGHLHEACRVIPGLPPETLPGFSYVPLGFTPVDHVTMVPTYPVGLSLLMIAVSPFTGWPLAPHVTMWLHAMAGVALMYGFARMLGLSHFAACFGAVLLAVSPLYVFMSTQAMSDLPAMVWCTAGMFFAWRSRSRTPWALAAGFCVAMAVLVRPSNLLVIVPVAICLGFDWRRWTCLVLGGSPGAVFLACFNLALYGKAIATGYGNISGSFLWENVPPTLLHYVTWLPVLLTPAIVLAFAMPRVDRSQSTALKVALSVWALVFLGFYALYYNTHETWWYLRFVLPAFPAIVLAMLLTGRAIGTRWSAERTRTIAVAALVATFAWGAFWTYDRSALNQGRAEKIYPDGARWARAHLPENSVVLVMQMSGAMLYYTNLTFLRYDQYDSGNFGPVEKFCASAGRPIYALLFPNEQDEVLLQRLPGHWTKVGSVRQVNVWRREGPERMPLVAWQELFSKRFAGIEVVAKAGAGWFNLENDRTRHWVWSGKHGTIDLDVSSKEPVALKIDFGLRSLVPRDVTITQDGASVWQGQVTNQRSAVSLTIPVTNGHAHLELDGGNIPAVRDSHAEDDRPLAFAVYDFTAELQPTRK